ncbi:MAG TPA: hypothetical protein VFZ34_20640 [Blastocatellia bacterium]|nr:hypothetical protein [Blastocatellia bacterium]
MKSKEELRARQNQLLAVYKQVEQELMTIPGVVGVGIGLKEVHGQLTDEICFRVYVAAKKDKADLAPQEIIPAEIQGFKTDVIKVYEQTAQVFVERREVSEHATLTGGIAVSSEKNPNEYGTLGWFATDTSNNSRVLLSNEHVLYPLFTIGDKMAKDGDRIAQPFHSKKCCCHTGVIANNVTSVSNDKVDCAIAKLDGSRPINRVITNKATDKILKVKGKDDAIAGAPVKKIGARSAFTKGIVVDIGAVVTTEQQVPLPGGGTVRQRKHQIIVAPASDETYENEANQVAFSNHGDSGSVILDEDDLIVGLLYGAVKENESLTLANNIDNVLTALEDKGHKIELALSEGGSFSGQAVTAAPKTHGFVTEEFPLLEQLAQTMLGQEWYPLLRQHRPEVMNLINHCRPVMVVWHRQQGPAFLAHLLNGARQPGYVIPREIEGVSRPSLLLKLAAALKDHGSDELRRDIERYAFDVLRYADECDRVEDLVATLNDTVMV